MPNGFTGSRDLHVRWRRRLVQGDERRAPKRFRIDPPHVPQPDGDPLPPPVLTVKTGIRSIIPRDAWKIWAMTGMAGALWLAVLAVGFYADATNAAWQGLLGLEAGHTSRWFGATCLLAAAQLSFLILWHRSLSRKDFFGRFRLWYWTGLVWLAFCAAEATTLHVVAAGWVESYYRLKVWNGVTVCWMLVAAPVTIGLMRLLRREMHLCRPSSFLLRCSAGAAAVSAVATLTGPLLPQSIWTDLISAGSTTLWQLLLACSTLMHTRFVIHITNEVAPKMRVRGRPSRLGHMLWNAVVIGVKGAVWLPWAAVGLTPLSRLWRRRVVANVSEPAKPQRKTRSTAKVEAEGTQAIAKSPLWRRTLAGTFGFAKARWGSWSESRAARKAERSAARDAAAAEREVQAAAKAEARRVADEERTAQRAAEKAQREAARVKAEEDRQRGLEKAKAERETADRERAATKAREKAERDAAQQAKEEAAREAVRLKEEAAREAQRAKEATQAATRQAEEAAAAAKAAAARQAAQRTEVERPAPAPKAEIPRPKGNYERSAPVSTAIKPQHVSYSDDEDEGGDEDDSRGLSRKERKRQKKMARNRE